jgi:hypothetical protein
MKKAAHRAAFQMREFRTSEEHPTAAMLLADEITPVCSSGESLR